MSCKNRRHTNSLCRLPDVNRIPDNGKAIPLSCCYGITVLCAYFLTYKLVSLLDEVWSLSLRSTMTSMFPHIHLRPVCFLTYTCRLSSLIYFYIQVRRQDLRSDVLAALFDFDDTDVLAIADIKTIV